MAKKKKVSKELLKWKKKKWVQIVAPKEFRNVTLGESLVMDAKDLVGRIMQSNMMSITGDIKKQNINVKFIITEIKDGIAQTKLLSYRIIPAAVKRMVRRARDRVDHSFVCKTKDKIEIRVKPILITRNNASQAVLSTLRKKSEFLIKKYLEKTNFDSFIGDVVIHKIQNELKKQLSDVYPLRICEIRWVEAQEKTALMKAKAAPKKKEEEPASEE